VWDLRAPHAAALHLPSSPSQGYVTCLALDPALGNWMVSGTSRGRLCLWDLRFLIPARTWHTGAAAAVHSLEALELPGPAFQDPGAWGLSPEFQGLPFVFTASGVEEVGLWRADTGALYQVCPSCASGGAGLALNAPLALRVRTFCRK